MRRGWILLTAALFLAGCGGTSNKQAAPASTGTPVGSTGKTIAVSEQEFSIMPRSISLTQTGTYTFKVTNDGQIPHALEVEGQGVEQKTAPIQPGSSATLTVDLPKNGSYEVYCPIDDHRSKGMEASMAVGGMAGSGTTTEDNTGSTSTQKKGGYGY